MDEKKLNELLKGIWDSLTDEQKEKIRACKTAQEAIVLAGEEGIELPDEILDAVAGGYIVDLGSEFLIVDDYERKEKASASTREEAQRIARNMGYSDQEVGIYSPSDDDSSGC